jgi:hypothetical protein
VPRWCRQRVTALHQEKRTSCASGKGRAETYLFGRAAGDATVRVLSTSLGSMGYVL